MKFYSIKQQNSLFKKHIMQACLNRQPLQNLVNSRHLPGRTIQRNCGHIKFLKFPASTY